MEKSMKTLLRLYGGTNTEDAQIDKAIDEYLHRSREAASIGLVSTIVTTTAHGGTTIVSAATYNCHESHRYDRYTKIFVVAILAVTAGTGIYQIRQGHA